MNPGQCSRNSFDKVADYNDILYYRPEDDRFNAVKKAGWYMYSMGYERPIVLSGLLSHGSKLGDIA